MYKHINMIEFSKMSLAIAPQKPNDMNKTLPIDNEDDNVKNNNKYETDDTTNSEKTSRSSSTVSRLITNLPLFTSDNYTPYFSLEFNLAVQEYCRNRNNHLITNSTNSSSIGSGSSSSSSSSSRNSYTSGINNQKQKSYSQNKHRFSYNTVNAPFQRVTRSCKVVVSGDVAVGKTCLVNRFGHDVYTSNYQTTIGVDFDLQKFNILGQSFMLQIWDTAGLERFRCITNSYYRGCQVALLVFDMSNMSTLANVLRWRDEVLSSAKTFDQMAKEAGDNASGNRKPPSNDQPLLFLVGTKCDLPIAETTRSFIKEQANKVAAILQAELWFVSAQTGENVQELFHRVAALSFNRCIQNEIDQAKFDTSTIGTCLKEKFIQQQKEFWNQSSKFIKITKKKEGDDRRSRCINIQCVIK